MQRRGAQLAIEPFVFKANVSGTEQPAGADAPARPLFAAYFEQIREITVEQQGHIKTRRPVAMVLQADPLIGRSAPQKDGADDVEHVLLQHDPAVAIDIGIGEIDRQCRIIIAQVGAEQQRLDVIQYKFQSGEIAGVGVEQAVRSAGRRADVAMAVQHDEGIVMLERAPWPRRRPGHRDVERLLRNQLDGPGRHDVGCDFG